MSSALRTGSLGLDILLGGGWKPGTVNEVWGAPGSGKTTLAKHAVQGLPERERCLWLCLGTELPHSTGRFLFAAPRNAEQAFETMTHAAGMGIGLIVVDSANGLVRQRELDGDPGYVPHPQREYKAELTALKKACKTGTTVLFLSKPRDKDRQPVRGTGISEKARDRAQLRIAQQHQDGTRLIWAQVREGSDFKVASFTVRPGTGVDRAEELARLAVDYGLIGKNGNWYAVNAVRRVQGITALTREVESSPALSGALDSAIRAKAGI